MESVWAPQTPFAPRPFEETLLEIRNPAAGQNPWTASLMPLRGRFPESSLFWLYAILAGASIVFVASLFLGQSAAAAVRQASLKPRVRAKLSDDDHDPPPTPSPSPDGPSFSEPPEALQDAKDPFCTQHLVQISQKCKQVIANVYASSRTCFPETSVREVLETVSNDTGVSGKVASPKRRPRNVKVPSTRTVL
ncbi:hypothetical protein ISCGN_022418 [Ixodes scapularis]